MSTEDNLEFGLHERIDTPALREDLARLGLEELAVWSKTLATEEISPAIAAHLSRLFFQLTLSLREKDQDVWKAALESFSEALQHSGNPLAGMERALPHPPFKQLLAIRQEDQQVVGVPDSVRPDVPLSVSALLTGSSRSPSLISQIQKELATSDRADWLVSFIKWSGVRPLRETLRRFTDQGAVPRLRIATTSYLGATDLKAIEFLAGLPNTEIRISYDTHRTRLHAKAYLFHRESGYGNAYIGSANVSRAALDEGLEWTAKVSQYELPYLWRQISAAFDSHWEEPVEFETFALADINRLSGALAAERAPTAAFDAAPQYQFFDLRPYGFQQEILDEIASERRAGIHKHLVIAATGTGKTMVAAFDYQRFAQGAGPGERPTLLFVAHREEILKQSLVTFRHVLRDDGFGDLVVGNATPSQTQHLFCSVQSWHSRGLDALDPRHFDYVVLDEAHHATAKTYQAILTHVLPKVLLGLTATPERADGGDIREDFGGRFTHEIRLADAIERRLLAPFHYFGIADEQGVDLSGLTWQRGGYVQSELENIFGANEARAKWVLHQVNETIAEPNRLRGLGFCVSQAHALYMAKVFTAWDMPSAALTAKSSKEERRAIQGKLVQRKIRFIFTVDLYNEGVDIQEVDTVLLLRPTESLTVFLQQLGRGLRLHEDKPHLTVLDFIAQQHLLFRFATRFRALSSQPASRIDDQINAGFPWLPSGCLVDLDSIAKERVLENIRNSLGMNKPQVVKSFALCLQQLGRRPGLLEMLNWLHFDEVDSLLRHGLPCRLLQRAGGEACNSLAPFEKGLRRGLRQLGIADDTRMIDALAHRIDQPDRPLKVLDEDERMRLSLAYSLLWGKERPGDGGFVALDDFIRNDPALLWDIAELIDYRKTQVLPVSGQCFPERTGVLELHASYTREQILLALGKGTLESPHTHREGTFHLPDKKIDVFFVTINKAEAEFSPTTMYEDYAITDSQFHWQSQSMVGPDSPTGKRYIQHQKLGYTPMLFVRSGKRHTSDLTAPFYFCGPLRYMRHEGSQPISIVWRLEYPMPAKIFKSSHREVA